MSFQANTAERAATTISQPFFVAWEILAGYDDSVNGSFDEHERASQLGAELSLDHDTVVLFFFATEADFQRGRFAIHRYVKEEGLRL